MFNKSKVDEKRAGQTSDSGKAAAGLRAPVIVFKPQLETGSGGSGGVDELKQLEEDDSKQNPASPLPQPT